MHPIHPEPHLDVVGVSPPQGPEREAPGLEPRRRSSLYLENGAPITAEDAGEVEFPITRPISSSSTIGNKAWYYTAAFLSVHPIHPEPHLDVVGVSPPQGPEREAPGLEPRPSSPASTTGEAGSPARPASVRSGLCTPSSTHTGEETQTGLLSGFAGSAPASPSSEAPVTPTDDESSNASTSSNPSHHNMRVMDGVLEDLLSLEDLPRTFCWARARLLFSLEE